MFLIMYLTTFLTTFLKEALSTLSAIIGEHYICQPGLCSYKD